MNRALPVLQNLRVASPCDADWDDMSGDERRRFCGACEKHVYDLTVLTPPEIVSLIEETEGKFCGRLYQRTDGRVLTDDCPVGVARLLRQAKRKTFRAAAMALTLAGSLIASLAYKDAVEGIVTRSVSTIENHTPAPVPPIPPIPPIQPPEHIVAGKIAVPPPPPPEPEILMGDVIEVPTARDMGEIVVE